MKNLLKKSLERGSLSELLSKLLKHFETHHFYLCNGHAQTFGFNGQLLMGHIEKEWHLSNLFNCDEPVFPTQNEMETEFVKIFPMVEKLPFSLVSFKHIAGNITQRPFLKDDEENFSQRFKPDSYTIMRKQTFVNPSLSTAFFHKQQRERKIWWRKFSSLPGRFAMTEISEENGNASVQVTADFPWGVESVESIRHLTEPSSLQVKEGRKTVSPHVVVSECQLEPATLTFMCDAYDPVSEETSRDVMRFHRKLAPFKITFAVSAATANTSKELTDLALVLARKIRKAGIPCLLLPEVAKRSLESNFSRADAMGTPYTIVLNDRTLTDGILGIRSRDTTLKEQSHVGIVVSYVEQLMKNY